MEDYHGVNASGMVDAGTIRGHVCQLCITEGQDQRRYTIASRITGSAGHDGRTFPYGAGQRRRQDDQVTVSSLCKGSRRFPGFPRGCRGDEAVDETLAQRDSLPSLLVLEKFLECLTGQVGSSIPPLFIPALTRGTGTRTGKEGGVSSQGSPPAPDRTIANAESGC